MAAPVNCIRKKTPLPVNILQDEILLRGIYRGKKILQKLKNRLK